MFFISHSFEEIYLLLYRFKEKNSGIAIGSHDITIAVELVIVVYA